MLKAAIYILPLEVEDFGFADFIKRDTAAEKIQKVARGMKARKEIPKIKAAIKLQAVIRGLKTREQVPSMIETQLRNKALYKIGPEILQKSDAATRLQAAIRNKKVSEMKKTIKPLPLPMTHELDKSGVTPLYQARANNSAMRTIQEAAANTIQARVRRENTQMKSMLLARNKYNKIGEMMQTQKQKRANEVGDDFIQKNARDITKRYSSQISEMKTRSNKPEAEKKLIVEKAKTKLATFNKIIEKKKRGPKPR